MSKKNNKNKPPEVGLKKSSPVKGLFGIQWGKGKEEGDFERGWWGQMWGDRDKYGEDEWGISETKDKIFGTGGDGGAFGAFQDLQGDIGNLWAGATNQMRVGRHFDNVQTSFENRYAGMENQFEGMQNRFAGLENTMEDLTVNQQQAQFEKEMGMQQEANMLDAMRAGGGFNAGNIQALAGAGSRRRQQASASIGQQESRNIYAAAQEASRLQTQEAAGASAVDMARASGAERTQMAIAGGAQAADQLSSQAELARAQGMMQRDIAIGQGAMEAQKIRLQGEADARQLKFDAAQASLAFLAGLQQANETNKDIDTA